MEQVEESIGGELTCLGIQILEPAGLAMIGAEAARFSALLRSMPEGIAADDFLREVGGAFPELRNVLSVRRISGWDPTFLSIAIHHEVRRIAGDAGQENRGFNLPANRAAAEARSRQHRLEHRDAGSQGGRRQMSAEGSTGLGARFSVILLAMISLGGCVLHARTEETCDNPPTDFQRAAVRRASVPDTALQASGMASLVVWVGGRALEPRRLSEALVSVQDERDTVTVRTSPYGLAAPLAHRANFVTVSVRRVGYRRSRDTVTLRTGFVDSIGFGLLRDRLCLEQVRVD